MATLYVCIIYVCMVHVPPIPSEVNCTRKQVGHDLEEDDKGDEKESGGQRRVCELALVRALVQHGKEAVFAGIRAGIGTIPSKPHTYIYSF